MADKNQAPDVISETSEENPKQEPLESPTKKDPLDRVYADLKSKDYRKKNAAIKTLGKSKDPKALDRLYDLASKPETKGQVRVSAIDAIGYNHRDKKFMELLINLAAEEQINKELKRVCITQLARFKDVRTISTLIAALDDEYRFTRFWALRGLLKIRDKKAIPGIVRCLGDEDTEIRKDAQNHLELLGAVTIPELVKALKIPDSNKFTRYGVTGLLGRIESPDVVDPLVISMNDEDERVQNIAIRALGKSGNPKAILPLISLYRTNPNRKHAIENALYKLGSAQSRILCYALAPLLLDSDPELQNLAYGLFEKLSTDSLMDLGDMVTDTSLEPDLLEAVKKAIRKLEA